MQGNQAVEFNFAARTSRAISVREAHQSLSAGKACWVDLDLEDTATAQASLVALGINRMAIERVLASAPSSRLVRHRDCLHLGATAVSVVDGRPRFSRLDLVIARELVVTAHQGQLEAVDQVLQTYDQDFRTFAKSIGFMLYEIFDRVADGYRRAIRVLEAEVASFQGSIYGDLDDAIFTHVARVNGDLLALRSALVSVQDILNKLAGKKSPFVSETTQPFLQNITGSLDRLADDLFNARDVLAECLSLYMGLVSHRTNRVLTRLTALSVVFMPLTFLCGVYGMNFHYMPELSWTFGYAAFWCIAAGIAGGLLLFMKRNGWL